MNFFGKNRRKVFLINPQFQWSFLRHCLSLAFAVLTVVYSANAFFFWNFKNKGLAMGLQPDHIFFRFVESQRVSMNWVFVGAAGTLAIVIMAFGLRLSHRIAGPLYNLTRQLKEAKEKGENLNTINFRERDYFPEVAEAVNEYLDTQETTKPKLSKAS